MVLINSVPVIWIADVYRNGMVFEGVRHGVLLLGCVETDKIVLVGLGFGEGLQEGSVDAEEVSIIVQELLGTKVEIGRGLAQEPPVAYTYSFHADQVVCVQKSYCCL